MINICRKSFLLIISLSVKLLLYSQVIDNNITLAPSSFILKKSAIINEQLSFSVKKIISDLNLKIFDKLVINCVSLSSFPKHNDFGTFYRNANNELIINLNEFHLKLWLEQDNKIKDYFINAVSYAVIKLFLLSQGFSDNELKDNKYFLEPDINTFCFNFKRLQETVNDLKEEMKPAFSAKSHLGESDKRYNMALELLLKFIKNESMDLDLSMFKSNESKDKFNLFLSSLKEKTNDENKIDEDIFKEINKLICLTKEEAKDLSKTKEFQDSFLIIGAPPIEYLLGNAGSNTSLKPGEYRPDNFGIQSIISPASENISSLINQLLKWLNTQDTYIQNIQNDFEKKIKAVELAAKVHYIITLIHPFWDGNGRISRLFTSYILQKYGIFNINNMTRFEYLRDIKKDSQYYINEKKSIRLNLFNITKLDDLLKYFPLNFYNTLISKIFGEKYFNINNNELSAYNILKRAA